MLELELEEIKELIWNLVLYRNYDTLPRKIHEIYGTKEYLVPRKHREKYKNLLEQYNTESDGH